MKVMDEGHKYELDSYDGRLFQTLTFMKREGEGYPGNHSTYPGTNCQEVIRALINRVRYLDRQDMCAESEGIICNLQAALLLFELRAARRHKRFLDLECMLDLEENICNKCGHIGCQCD